MDRRLSNTFALLSPLVVAADPEAMSTTTETEPRPWESESGLSRQGLARRAELLAWMLEDPKNSGRSGKEIAQTCPVYANWNARDPYARVMQDLRNMEQIECTVVGSRNRPVLWSATALGTEIAGRA